MSIAQRALFRFFAGVVVGSVVTHAVWQHVVDDWLRERQREQRQMLDRWWVERFTRRTVDG